MAYWVAKLFRSGPEQFWTGLIAVVLPWGFVANLLSVGHALTPIGWLVIQIVLLSLIVWIRRRLNLPTYPLATPAIPRIGLNLLPTAILLLAIVFVFALGVIQDVAQPLRLGDEMGYHGPRVIYWIGNGSIFPFDTHNDRQNVFGYQGELAFLWSVLFTRSELIGSLVFGLAGPLSAIGVFLVARKTRASVLLALLLTTLYICTPLVFAHLGGLKPEIWFTLYLLGAIWWTLQAIESDVASDRRSAFFLAGLFSILAVATKFNALAFAPFLLVAPWVVCGRREPLNDSLAVASGLIGGGLVCGLILLFTFNLVREGGIMGSKEMQALHASEPSVRQVRTHLARLPLLLLDLPSIPSASLRSTLERTGRDYLRFVDADQNLPMEKKDAWPGAFVVAVRPTAGRFSLAGVLALLTLLAGFACILIESVRTFPSIRISRYNVAFICVASMMGAVVIMVRWMTHSGLPDRFLIPCVACLVAISPAYFPLSGRVLVVAVAVVVSLYSGLPEMIATTSRMQLQPITLDQVEGPFAGAMAELPQSARVLLFSSQHAPEYGLFGPRDGFPRRVIPWGKQPFNAIQFQTFLAENQITHILFENPEASYFGWGPSLDLRPFLFWLKSQPTFKSIELAGQNVKLFATVEAANLTKETGRPPRLVSGVPGSLPLATVDPNLRPNVGLDGGRFSSPWPIENLGKEEAAFLWLGSGQTEGFQFRVWSQSGRSVSISMKVSAGPSRSEGNRTVAVTRKEDERSQTQTFVASGRLTFPVPLNVGWNSFVVSAVEQPNVGAMTNGDSRHLIVGLHEILITAK